MKFFLDSADLNEVKEADALSLLDGVTTNPTLIAKAGGNYEDRVKQICKVTKGPVSAEVISTDFNGMVKEGLRWSKVAKNVVVKIPTTLEGVKAIKTLSGKGVKVNATLCFSENQALLVAKAGAFFVSPFIGRLDDLGQEGIQLIENIRIIYDNYDFKTKVLAASIRHPLHVAQVAMVGADVATMPLKVMKQLVRHPLTDVGLETFLSDYKRAKK